MEADNQHLDFLISQYVDGCLEGSNKKLVEQQMLNDPAARRLYAEHRETQDLLDDWGNRIPLIHWDDFDKKLAGRLDADAAEEQRATAWRRRMKPWAIAAGLLVAVGVGYGWHAMSGRGPANAVAPLAQVQGNPAGTKVEFPELQVARRPSHASIVIDEKGSGGEPVTLANLPEVSAPADAVAFESLRQNVEFGFNHLEEGMRSMPANGTVAVAPSEKKDDSDTPK